MLGDEDVLPDVLGEEDDVLPDEPGEVVVPVEPEVEP